MKNSFFCKSPYINLYDSTKKNKKISSQLLYGEKFTVLKKIKKYLKIKTSYDNYSGYILDRKYKTDFKPTHKVKKLKTKIYKSNNYLPFSSKIQILKKKKNYVMFEKNRWINKKDLCHINKKENNFNRIFKLYLNCKYRWGGGNFDGIDCSALIQIFYKYNNKFFPRDTKDQVKFKKGFKNKKVFKKGDIIYWKGHVAVCINSKQLIHAYGPKKKVLIMPIKKTIEIIEKTANLKVTKIFKV